MADPKFCVLPFLQLTLMPSGHVLPCCLRSDYSLGNVKDDSIHDMWNGEKLQALRREFLEGNPKTCRYEMESSHCNQFYNYLEPKIEKAAIVSKPIQRLDLRMNGKCNLECVMCDFWKEPDGVYDKTDFWEYAPKHIFPHLLEVDVLGGEPFVQRDTFRLLDEVTACNPHCSWNFTTNAQWHFNEKVRSRFDKVNLGRITVSIDGATPGTFSKIRVKGDLGLTQKTLIDLVDYRLERAKQGRPFEIFITMTVQQGNYHEIPMMIALSKRLDVTLNLYFLMFPPRFSLLVLDRKHRQKIIEEIESWPETRTHAELVGRILSPLKESLDPNLRLASLIHLFETQRDSFQEFQSPMWPGLDDTDPKVRAKNARAKKKA